MSLWMNTAFLFWLEYCSQFRGIGITSACRISLSGTFRQISLSNSSSSTARIRCFNKSPLSTVSVLQTEPFMFLGANNLLVTDHADWQSIPEPTAVLQWKVTLVDISFKISCFIEEVAEEPEHGFNCSVLHTRFTTNSNHDFVAWVDVMISYSQETKSWVANHLHDGLRGETLPAYLEVFQPIPKPQEIWWIAPEATMFLLVITTQHGPLTCRQAVQFNP